MLIKGSKVHINRELREGVSKGQTFVVGRTEALRDPDTGELLDVSMEKAGTMLLKA